MTLPFSDENDIFQAELLPAYAKTYILPRKMRRASFASADPGAGPGAASGTSARKQSHARRQSTVTPEFTMSILKASLEERKISNGSDIIEEEEENEENEEEGGRMMSRNSRKSLVPCNASGGMREYADFVKEGNFIPTSVLNPDLGMEAEVFAEVKSSGGLRSGRLSEMSLRDGEPVNLDEAFTKVTEMLGKVEAGAEQRRSSLVTSEDPQPRRHKGRRVRMRSTVSLDNDLPKGAPGAGPFQATTSDIFGFNLNPDSDTSSRSSGYQSQHEFYVEGEIIHSFSKCPKVKFPDVIPDYDETIEANLLDVLVEDKIKFQSSYTVGDASMEIFMDRKNPWNKSIHPALPKIIQEKLQENRKRGRH